MVPPKWGLVSYVLFTIVPMSYKIKNTWLILIKKMFWAILLREPMCRDPIVGPKSLMLESYTPVSVPHSLFKVFSPFPPNPR